MIKSLSFHLHMALNITPKALFGFHRVSSLSRLCDERNCHKNLQERFVCESHEVFRKRNSGLRAVIPLWGVGGGESWNGICFVCREMRKNMVSWLELNNI